MTFMQEFQNLHMIIVARHEIQNDGKLLVVYESDSDIAGNFVRTLFVSTPLSHKRGLQSTPGYPKNLTHSNQPRSSRVGIKAGTSLLDGTITAISVQLEGNGSKVVLVQSIPGRSEKE